MKQRHYYPVPEEREIVKTPEIHWTEATKYGGSAFAVKPTSKMLILPVRKYTKVRMIGSNERKDADVFYDWKYVKAFFDHYLRSCGCASWQELEAKYIQAQKWMEEDAQLNQK